MLLKITRVIESNCFSSMTETDFYGSKFAYRFNNASIFTNSKPIIERELFAITNIMSRLLIYRVLNYIW